MKSINTLLGTAVASVAMLAIATPANAAITIDAPTTVDVTGPTGNALDFSLGYSDSGTNTPFTEVLAFTNTLAGDYTFTLATSGKGASDVDFTSALITGTGIGAPISLDTLFNNDQFENLGKSLSLGAGSYTFTIKGTRGLTGSFGGSVTFGAVPEPATWAMMILGLGVAGAAMRRRQRQSVRYNFA